jgi:hypothetical protein
VFDNDNMRDNPSIFIIEDVWGNSTRADFDIASDYASARVKTTVPHMTKSGKTVEVDRYVVQRTCDVISCCAL